MDNTIRLMIADDHPMVRNGLAALLGDVPGLAIVALAANGAEAIEMFHRRLPDVILMDLVMPVMDGITATATIMRDAPGARIVILSSYDADEYVYRALHAGAKSYLLKDTPIEHLIEVIRTVRRGGRWLAPELGAKLADHVYQSELTEREFAVLREMAKGATNQEIASALNIAPGTVKTHVNHLLAKLQVTDRTQAVIAAFKRGFVQL